MIKSFILAIAILAVTLATAGTVPAPGGSYKITLAQPSVVNGTDLKAGEYRLNVGTDKVQIVAGKVNMDVPVKVETADKKFESTSIRYTTVNGKSAISEIRFGGSKTRLIFAQ
ncbi:MAG TPA: hypothetical protein VKU19_36785 [Bryobacteraceae bacterium]|nr:hypothetical protein [Bryobacteraceae bacterium]